MPHPIILGSLVVPLTECKHGRAISESPLHFARLLMARLGVSCAGPGFTGAGDKCGRVSNAAVM